MYLCVYYEQRLQFVVVIFGDGVLFVCLFCYWSGVSFYQKSHFVYQGGWRVGVLTLGGVEVVQELSSSPRRRAFIRLGFPAADFSI